MCTRWCFKGQTVDIPFHSFPSEFMLLWERIWRSPASLCAIATYCPGSFGLFNLGKQTDEWVKASMNTPLPIYAGSPSAVSPNTACWAESTSGCSQSLLPLAVTMTMDASAFLPGHFAFSPCSSAASGSASLMLPCLVLLAHGPEQWPGACPVPARTDKGRRLLYRINYFSYGQDIGIQCSIPICLKEVFLVYLYIWFSLISRRLDAFHSHTCGHLTASSATSSLLPCWDHVQ